MKVWVLVYIVQSSVLPPGGLTVYGEFVFASKALCEQISAEAIALQLKEKKAVPEIECREATVEK